MIKCKIDLRIIPQNQKPNQDMKENWFFVCNLIDISSKCYVIKWYCLKKKMVKNIFKKYLHEKDEYYTKNTMKNYIIIYI